MRKKISKFICKELLYDYLSGALDPQRKAKIEEYLKEDPEIKAELDSLETALKYTSQLKKIKLDRKSTRKLRDVYQKEGQTYYIKKAGKRAAQASSLVAILALFYFYFPIDKVFNYFKRDPNKIVIAEIQTTGKLNTLQPNEVVEEEPESLLSAEEDAAQNADHSEADGEEHEVRLSPEQEKKLREELEKQESEQKAATEVEAQKPAEPVPTPTPRKGEVKTSGFVYRAFISTETRDAVADALVQRIESLGGQKAGSVEIGWEKPNGNRYFHFTMTESNFEILKSYLNTIVPVEVSKSPHPRVMPAGQVRMILEVQSP
ncbi:MAG: hypothetical protein KDD37_09945 [Bdellovibrionales bacterium]|nr:hypothetical protein [Bdellovibrionales bacterium]